eukprot:657338-Lingulodinium_polyedra.AAC.1
MTAPSSNCPFLAGFEPGWPMTSDHWCCPRVPGTAARKRSMRRRLSSSDGREEQSTASQVPSTSL